MPTSPKTVSQPIERVSDRNHERSHSHGGGSIGSIGAIGGGSHHNSISSQSNTSSRKPSIVEILSSPPPLPNGEQDEINSITLSRNNSLSSRSSSVTQNNKDWSEIQLSELIQPNKLISVNSSFSIQRAFETLIKHDLTSLPVSITHDSHNLDNCLTFDYSDLNTYLLLVMNKINASHLNMDSIDMVTFDNHIKKAKQGEEIPVDFIIKLHPKTPFIKIPESETLLKVTEVLGNGVHRVAITSMIEQGKIIGVISQRRLIKYIWENARRFPSLEFYLNSSLQDLKIGATSPITIYDDQLLIDALYKMFIERISSLAVIDRKKNLIGNISIVDVKNISSSANSHLLFKSVINFISYNLSQKGIEEGKDQFPIFHVNSQSSLGRVIAKLVATESHRLWIVESNNGPITIEDTLNTNNLNQNENGLPGKLVGVVTLTDILGLFASSKSMSGRKIDPQFARNQRRRSSTSTTRSSLDTSSLEMFKK